MPRCTWRTAGCCSRHRRACWSSDRSLPGHRQNPMSERFWVTASGRDGLHTADSCDPLRRHRHTALAAVAGQLPQAVLAVERGREATLLQQTQQRLQGLDALAAPLLICNEDHRFIVAEQMRQIGVEPNAILLEPMGRNTAPAVTVAALQATANGETRCCWCWQRTT